MLPLQVKDSYTDNNGTQWTLCEMERNKRKIEVTAPLVIHSYLHALTVTQFAGDKGINMDVSLLVNKGRNFQNKCKKSMYLSGSCELETQYKAGIEIKTDLL